MSEITKYEESIKREGNHEEGERRGMHSATQTGVEAAIAQNEVEHLNSKRIQDKLDDVKEEIKEDGCKMIYPGYGFGGCGDATGLLIGLLAGGGFGWGGRGGYGCHDGGHGCNDTIEIIRDNHDGILNLKDEASRNALFTNKEICDGNMRLQKEIDCNAVKLVEVKGCLEKDIFCGFKEINDRLCCMETERLKEKLCEKNEKIEELKSQLRDQTQTQTILAAISALGGTAA